MLADLARALDGGGTLLIDGRSGAGKSSLAAAVAAAVPGCVVVHLDDIYPGWDGLDWARRHVADSLLGPRGRGRAGRWRSWDWAESAPAAWHAVPVGAPLIVEGVGALTARTRQLADLGVWVEASAAERKRRALARDGETYAAQWNRWAAQEEFFVAVHRPRDAADLIAHAADGGFHIVPTGVNA